MNEKRGSGIEINMLDPDQKREREILIHNS